MEDFYDWRIVLRGSLLLVKTSVSFRDWLVLKIRMYLKSFVDNFGMLLFSADSLGYIGNISIRRTK